MKKLKKTLALMLTMLMVMTCVASLGVSAADGYHQITLDEVYHMTMGYSGEVVLFSPEEDGWYEFYTVSDEDTYANFYNSDWEEITYADDTDEGYDFCFKEKLYSGNTYRLYVSAYIDDDDIIEFDLYVEETLAAEEATISREPDCPTVVEGYESDTISMQGLEVQFTLSDGSTVDWSYNDGGLVGGSEVDVYYDCDDEGLYYVDIECDDAFVRYYFTTIENPVDYIEYSGTPIEFYENTNGRYDEEAGLYCYDYYLPYDGTITIHYLDGRIVTASVDDIIDGVSVDYYDEQYITPWCVGSENYITISYLGVTTKTPVTILPTPFESVVINSVPDYDYVFGDRRWGLPYDGTYLLYNMNLEGLSFTLKGKDGSEVTYTADDFDMKKDTLDGFDVEIPDVNCTELGTYEITINYKGFEIKYDADVIESPVESIEVLEDPFVTECEGSYSPTYYGMKLRVNYKDNTSDTVTISEDNIQFSYERRYMASVAVGENVINIYSEFDTDAFMNYSLFSCLGVDLRYLGINYIVGREVESLVVSKITPDGDDTRFKAVYADGEEENFVLESVFHDEYEPGYVYGVAKTQNGMIYYDVEEYVQDGEVIGYDFYIFYDSVYVEASQDTTTADYKGNSLSLSGTIGVNFFYDISEDVLADEDAVVKFTVPDTGSTYTTEVPVSEGVFDPETGYYKFTCNVAVKEMTSTIKAQLITSLAQTEEVEYTVFEYAEYMLKNKEKFVYEQDLVKAILNYGAASQTYFGYNTDKLANDTEYMTDADRAPTPTNFSFYEPVITGEGDGIEYIGATLSLKSNLALNFYFRVTDESETAPEILVNGEPRTLTQKGNTYMLSIRDIPLFMYAVPYELDLQNGCTISYSPFSYCYLALQSSNQKLVDLVEFLSDYYYAVGQYWGE